MLPAILPTDEKFQSQFRVLPSRLIFATHDPAKDAVAFPAVLSVPASPLWLTAKVVELGAVGSPKFCGRAGPSGLPRSNSPILGKRFISGVA